jgi:glycosyltransferase involved in cell wall biosynthesis
VMQRVAKEIDADAIWVSKPRLPAYALAVLAKEARNRPLVLDVDDHELAFFDEDDGLAPGEVLRMRGDKALTLPFERAWTRFCEPLVDAADLVTVSNVALQSRFGGVIVPHARDERVFDPSCYDRDATRERLGVSPETRLLLFGGTPRVHKGIVEVLRALDEIGDERYRVLLFGTREFDELRKDIGPLERWAIPLPYQRFDDLPELVGAADLACVLQDPTHPVARYQLPAKVTDALAMGVPCLVRPVRPLASLIEADVLQVLHEGESLPDRITRIFEHHDDALDRAKRGRQVFEETYSYQAVSDAIAPQFDALIERPPPVSPRLRTVVDVPRQLFGGKGERSRRPARIPGRPVTKVAPDGKYDVVVFWKQNDTGI